MLKDLINCDREIREKLDHLRSGGVDGDPPGAGMLLGLYDMSCERRLIMQEMEGAGIAPDVVFSGGASSSPCPRYELIPLAATTALARRFERGIVSRGSGAWNALSENRVTKDFVLNRLGHAMRHIQEAIIRIAVTGEVGPQQLEDGGDAGAIMFAGAALAEYETNYTGPQPGSLEKRSEIPEPGTQPGKKSNRSSS